MDPQNHETRAGDRVDATTAPVDRMAKKWDVVRPLLGGTAAMREAGERLLPRWPNESRDDWLRRCETATLFPAYRRTVKTLSAKPFSKPVTVEESVPPAVRELLEDVDMQGRNLDQFAAAVMEEALGFGLAGVLVDFPTGEGAESTQAGDRTVEAERRAGLRPYWVHVHPWQVLGWRARQGPRGLELAQLRLAEEVEERDGAYGTRCVGQVRVLEPGRWQVWRRATGDGLDRRWVLHAEGATTLDCVPFAPFYGSRVAFMAGEPPLEDLANLNVKHWQSQSDQDTLLHVARVPVLVATGVDTGFKLVVGASSAVVLDDPKADLRYVEHSGAAVGAGKTALDDLKEEMRQAGAELLVLKQIATATQVASEDSVGACELQRITLGVQDSLALALELTAKWLGLPSGGEVTLFTDFAAATLAEASAALLLQSTAAGSLSRETYFAELKRRGIVASHVDWEAELERIGAEGPPPGAEPEPGAAP